MSSQPQAKIQLHFLQVDESLSSQYFDSNSLHRPSHSLGFSAASHFQVSNLVLKKQSGTGSF